MSVSCVVVIDHALDLNRVLPEIAKPARVVVGSHIILVHLVAQPRGEEGEELADVLGVGVHESEGSQSAELHQLSTTAKPAAGKAIRLFPTCSLVTAYDNLSTCPLARAHSSKRPSTCSILLSFRGSVLILPDPSRMMGLPYLNILRYTTSDGGMHKVR